MISKYKKNDVVYFTDRSYASCGRFPCKGSSYETTGRISEILEGEIVRVEWENGLESTYYVSSLKHRYRIKVSFRWIKDVVKHVFNELKDEFSTYRMYRRLKKNDLVCLKHSTEELSSCVIGEICEKHYPQITVYWNTRNTYYSYELVTDIEHYTDLNPNKLFQQHKMGVSR